MNAEQLKHYLAGGKFTAIYNPKKTDDLSQASLACIGDKMVVFQNMIIVPLEYDGYEKYQGQHAFNSPEIFGWFPEEDLDDLEILEDEFISGPQKLPQHCYKLHYSTREQVKGNFGKVGNELSLPFITGRSYSSENHEYVKKLSTPQADKIEYALYDGTTETPEWKTIFEQESVEV